MPKYTVFDKDTIKTEIMPYLSVAKRGYVSQGSLIEVVNAILHKLKSGGQWHQLPVEHLFGDVVLGWNAVYHHFRKWCRLGEWQSMFAVRIPGDIRSLIPVISVHSVDGLMARS